MNCDVGMYHVKNSIKHTGKILGDPLPDMYIAIIGIERWGLERGIQGKDSVVAMHEHQLEQYFLLI